MYQLYYYPRNASFAPHWVLEELGLTFELVLVDRTVNAQKDDAYKALNPAGRIPTLVDGDNVIFESAAICLHLCENTPDNTLTPEFGDPSRSHFFQWLFYLTTTVQSELMVYLYPEKHTIDSQLASAVARAQEQRLHDMFQLLDQQLENKKYLVNDTFTLCDCFLFMLSMWASKLTRPPMSFSNLARYLDNLTQRSALARVAKKEGIDLSLFRL